LSSYARAAANDQREVTMARFNKILVASDGTETCAAAIDAAIELAGDLGAELLALCVSVQPVPAASGLGGTMDPVGAADEGIVTYEEGDPASAHGRAKAVASGVVGFATEAGVVARPLVWEGPAGDAIIEAAQAAGAQLIVVGSHCRNVVGRLFLGSVSEYVVRHSPIPVMVVRPRGSETRAR